MRDPLDQIFKNLDRWRHLPSYQLERRFDIFLTPYLRDIVAEEMELRHEDLEAIFIPEFPLLVKPPPRTRNGTERMLSNKVDFVFFDKTPARRVLFVELKTDQASARPKQNEYLVQAQRDGFQQILRDLARIVNRTTSCQKYFHLLTLLARVGCIELHGCNFSDLKPGRPFGRDVFAPNDGYGTVEILFLLPQVPQARDRNTSWHYIDFSRVLSHVDRFDDAASRLVAARLRAWQSPAGAADPALSHE